MSAGREDVWLSPLTDALRPGVLAIAVAPEQVRFAGTPAAAVPVADREPARQSVVIVRGVEPVGYFQLDRRSVPGAPAGPHILGLRALAIDRAVQGQGVGTAALQALPAYVREHFPERTVVALTVNVDNPPAIALYARTGFRDAGTGLYRGGYAGPQHVLLLDV